MIQALIFMGWGFFVGFIVGPTDQIFCPLEPEANVCLRDSEAEPDLAARKSPDKIERQDAPIYSVVNGCQDLSKLHLLGKVSKTDSAHIIEFSECLPFSLLDRENMRRPGLTAESPPKEIYKCVFDSLFFPKFPGSYVLSKIICQVRIPLSSSQLAAAVKGLGGDMGYFRIWIRHLSHYTGAT